MRLIIDCEPERLDDALRLLREQVSTLKRYDRLGWGWSFHLNGARYFVRAIRRGISVTQRSPNP